MLVFLLNWYTWYHQTSQAFRAAYCHFVCLEMKKVKPSLPARNSQQANTFHWNNEIELIVVKAQHSDFQRIKNSLSSSSSAKRQFNFHQTAVILLSVDFFHKLCPIQEMWREIHQKEGFIITKTPGNNRKSVCQPSS